MVDIIAMLMLFLGIGAADSDYPLIPFIIAITGAVIILHRSKGEKHGKSL